MSRRNGDRSKFHINQKRKVVRRQRIRALRAALLGRQAAPAKTSGT